MFRFFNLLIFLIVGFAFSGCSKKDSKVSVLNGTYAGTFYYHTSSANASSGPVTITFSENNYGSSHNQNRIPAGGSGTYQISGQVIKFNDINFWTADFDYGLVLNGNYTYQIKSDSLIFNKTNSTTSYQYRLKRTN